MSDSQLRKLSPVRIFEQIVDQIRGLIFAGEFVPGDKLPPEQELEKQLNVSRSSIREALRVLEFEGLVEVRRGSGTFVAPYSHLKKGRIEVAKWLDRREGTLVQFLQVREVLEGLAAYLAASNMTESVLGELISIMDQASEVVRKNNSEGVDFDELASLDSQFHLLISRTGGNDIANELISYVIPAFQASNKAVIYISDSLDNLVRDHKAILDALKERHPERAEKAMRSHIARVRNEIREVHVTHAQNNVPVKPVGDLGEE